MREEALGLSELAFNFLTTVWGRLQILWSEPARQLTHWGWEHQAYYLLFPEISLLVGVAVILLVDVFLGRKAFNIIIWIAIVALFSNFLMTLHLMYMTSRFFSYGLGLWWGQLETIDPYALFFKQLMDWGDILLLLVLFRYPLIKRFRSEFIILILSATIAFDLMVGSSDLLAIYVMTEFGSIMLYLLAAFHKDKLKSLEGGLKYFITGAASSAAMLFGISYIYGIVGSTNIYEIKIRMMSIYPDHPLVLFAMVLIIVGVGYKIGVAPFHLWAPDAYEGAPTPATAFISVFPKMAGFAVLMRIYLVAFAPVAQVWLPLFVIMAILTMFVGNIMALTQTSFKRLMAYSGIAQMGYVLIGVICAGLAGPNEAATSNGFWAAMYYLLIYMFMNLGAFIIGMMNEVSGGSDHLDTFNGFHQRSPFLSFFMTICLLALTGIPPTAGFIAKFVIFVSAVDYITRYPAMFLLVLMAIINTVIAVYYYVGIIKRIYLLKPLRTELARPFTPIFFQRVAVLVPALASLVLGIFYIDAPMNYVKGAWFMTYYTTIA
ncbi:NADH-quinone oxidoreductase subunit N [bacterium]|nr:NADH-quinone oxidoreductase subunit N [bacterium]